MFTTFTKAPTGILLHIEQIEDKKLQSSLFRMGIVEQNTIYKMDAEADTHSVRIKTANGETILAGGMGGKIVAHLDDGRMIPLVDMKPKEHAHIETIEGGEELQAAIAALGLKNGDEFELVRLIPSMQYIAETNGRKIKLSEGMAAKILGSMPLVSEQQPNTLCQFANASANVPFTVHKIIGGKNSNKVMDSYNIKENDILTLLSVENAPVYTMSKNDKFMLATSEGLRVILEKEQADNIKVSTL